MSKRCARIHHKSATLSQEHVAKRTQKQLIIDPAQEKCGGTRKNPHQEATFLHENVAKHKSTTKLWQNTKKTWKLILRRAQTPWPGVFNQGVFRVCPMSKRHAWIHYKSATLSHEHVAKHAQKQLKIDPAQQKCGGTRKNPHQKATFLHENVAKHTNQLRKCGKTHKSTWKLILRRAQTPWPGVFNQGVFRACPMSKRHAWIHYKSATLSHEHVAKHTQKQLQKCGGTRKNTQKHLKIDPSQGPNTMAWRVQPRRFSSMSDVKTSRLNPL